MENITWIIAKIRQTFVQFLQVYYKNKSKVVLLIEFTLKIVSHYTNIQIDWMNIFVKGLCVCLRYIYIYII